MWFADHNKTMNLADRPVCMSTNQTPTLPHKKPNVLWWLGGVFLLLVFLFLVQLFGPDPPIIVSRETTFITSPLRQNGLPDYEKYVLDLSREGVTPENNAAVLLWQALWPGELDPKYFAMMADELGLEKIPDEEDALVPLRGLDSSIPSVPLADDIIERSRTTPWKSDQLPTLAKWLIENQAPLDLVVEASRRPRYYSPSPTLLDSTTDSAYLMMLPGLQSTRAAARALSTRAMWHLGEGRPAEAWRDLLATHRLARLVGQGPTLVEQMVAIAIDGFACRGTQTLLHRGDLDNSQLANIRQHLENLPTFSNIASSINLMERLAFIDAIVHLGASNSDQFIDELDLGDQFKVTAVVAVDWNIVLRMGNQNFDRLSTAAKMRRSSERQGAFAQINYDLSISEARLKQPTELAAGLLSCSARSKLVGSMMISLLLPAINAISHAEDRANTSFDLTRIAAALAVYRSERGAYPEALDDLVPEVVDQLPVDLYYANPFLYRRTADGYLLYSAGVNGVDDGGSNEQMSIFEGCSLDEIDGAEMADPATYTPSKIPPGSDDISIRVPQPAFKLPPFPESQPHQ
jgi:hypothetical protein